MLAVLVLPLPAVDTARRAVANCRAWGQGGVRNAPEWGQRGNWKLRKSLISLAERGGFEPPTRETRVPDFESGAIDHSATSPGRRRRR